MTAKNVYLLLFALLLTGCTLLDHDLRDLPEAPGFREVVHVKKPKYDLDYQYQADTYLFDDLSLTYVSSMDYDTGTLYMEDFTPDDLLPSAGRVLAAPVSDQLPYGLCHRVVQVSRKGMLYALRLERAPLDDAYKHLHVHFNDSVEVADSAIVADSTTASSQRTRAVQVSDYSPGWITLDVIDLLNAVAYAKGWSVPRGNHVKFDTKGLKDGPVKGAVDLTGDVQIKVKPIVKAGGDFDIDSRMLDFELTLGYEMQFVVSATGSMALEVDLLDIRPEIKKKLTISQCLVPELALFVSMGAAADFNMSLSGSVSKTFSKKSHITYYARNNNPGYSDGVSVDPYNGSLSAADTAPAYSDGDASSSSFDANFAFSSSFMLGYDVKLYVGVPNAVPQVGLSAGLRMGPVFKLDGKSNKPENDYKRALTLSFDLTPQGKVYFDLFKGLTIDWSFTDALARALNIKDGLTVSLAKKSWPIYPTLDLLQVKCVNGLATSEEPLFRVSFEVPDRGLFVSQQASVRPIYNIYKKGAPWESTPLYTRDSGKPLPQDLTEPALYGWNFGSSEYDTPLERKTDYEMEVQMVERDDATGTDHTLYRRRLPFKAVTPSMLFHGHFVTAQWRRVAAHPDDHGAYWTRYDWTFRTIHSFSGRQYIQRWGFRAAGKLYTVEGPPSQDDVAIPIRWKVLDSRGGAKRSVKFYPYIEVETGSGVRMDVMEPFTVDLEFDPESWDNTVERELRQAITGDYYLTGYDIDELFEIPIELTSKLSRREYGTITTDDSGQPVIEFVIE